MLHRKERISSLIHEVASGFLEEHLDEEALATITRIDLSPDLRRAKIFVSILPEEKEVEVLEEINKLRPQFIKTIKSKFKMKYLPRFEFELDKGEKARQRVEEILKKL